MLVLDELLPDPKENQALSPNTTEPTQTISQNVPMDQRDALFEQKIRESGKTPEEIANNVQKEVEKTEQFLSRPASQEATREDILRLADLVTKVMDVSSRLERWLVDNRDRFTQGFSVEEKKAVKEVSLDSLKNEKPITNLELAGMIEKMVGEVARLQNQIENLRGIVQQKASLREQIGEKLMEFGKNRREKQIEKYSRESQWEKIGARIKGRGSEQGLER
ncbi:hypothetical protein LLE49_19855 [Alicyclobacillus tolerans]|uniref:hypothetical protein n=1 Tax=Alicyclobacillus tolerans TaxID=90970 RepID=UPI001F3AC661|nr:hypothetical protein [Alicyclobacillus tolerans]MCF8566979.1 hypothetical protein [Alicyclobacillus tolerans]